jgi:DNA mismatch repair ATPase MutS
MVELSELMAILKHNNSNTLIIGDEICKGTFYYFASAK